MSFSDWVAQQFDEHGGDGENQAPYCIEMLEGGDEDICQEGIAPMFEDLGVDPHQALEIAQDIRVRFVADAEQRNSGRMAAAMEKCKAAMLGKATFDDQRRTLDQTKAKKTKKVKKPLGFAKAKGLSQVSLPVSQSFHGFTIKCSPPSPRAPMIPLTQEQMEAKFEEEQMEAKLEVQDDQGRFKDYRDLAPKEDGKDGNELRQRVSDFFDDSSDDDASSSDGELYPQNLQRAKRKFLKIKLKKQAYKWVQDPVGQASKDQYRQFGPPDMEFHNINSVAGDVLRKKCILHDAINPAYLYPSHGKSPILVIGGCCKQHYDTYRDGSDSTLLHLLRRDPAKWKKWGCRYVNFGQERSERKQQHVLDAIMSGNHKFIIVSGMDKHAQEYLGPALRSFVQERGGSVVFVRLWDIKGIWKDEITWCEAGIYRATFSACLEDNGKNVSTLFSGCENLKPRFKCPMIGNVPQKERYFSTSYANDCRSDTSGSGTESEGKDSCEATFVAVKQFPLVAGDGEGAAPVSTSRCGKVALFSDREVMEDCETGALIMKFLETADAAVLEV